MYVTNKLSPRSSYFIVVILFLAVLFSTTGCTKTTSELAESLNPRNYKLYHSFSVNATSAPKVRLDINIPSKFTTSPEYVASFTNGVTPILEYIPKGESFQNWSKIFTINRSLSAGTSAEHFTKSISDELVVQTKRFNLLKQEVTRNSLFQSANTAIQYMKHDGVVEMLYMEYYSGPYDCIGIQYTEKLGFWLDETAAKIKASDIKREISKYVKVIRY